MIAGIWNKNSLRDTIIICCEILTFFLGSTICLHHFGAVWQPDSQWTDKEKKAIDITGSKVLHASTSNCDKRYSWAKCHS